MIKVQFNGLGIYLLEAFHKIYMWPIAFYFPMKMKKFTSILKFVILGKPSMDKSEWACYTIFQASVGWMRWSLPCDAQVFWCDPWRKTRSTPTARLCQPIHHSPSWLTHSETTHWSTSMRATVKNISKVKVRHAWWVDKSIQVISCKAILKIA